MWFKIQDQKITINILVKLNAKKTDFLGKSDQGLLIALHEKPHQGAANKELISFLAKLLHIPKTEIKLQRGEKSKFKQVLLPLTDNVKKLINLD